MRYLKGKFERMKLFLAAPPIKKWPVTYEQLLALAERIRSESRERASLPGHQRRMALDDSADQAVASLV
jgi:hypothetical protein